MKDLEFKYEKVGHIIMLEEDDWNRIVKYLAKNGIRVDEASLTKHAPDSLKAVAKSQPKSRKSKSAVLTDQRVLPNRWSDT